MRLWISVLAVAMLIAGPVVAASKQPSAYDGVRDGFLYNGKQNMPFKLHGVANAWHLACLQGKVPMCVKMAQVFETGAGDMAGDMRVAIAYWLKACELGSGPACARAAAILRDGSASFTNETLAQQTAERGCNVLKDPSACAASAGGTRDPTRKAELIEASCASGADDGCRLKANRLFYEVADPASRGQALTMYDQACKAKRAWGCLGIADAYGQGLGVPKDPARANEAARVGCTIAAGDRLRLCTLHGMNLARATNDKATLNKGELFLDTSCKGGDAIACNRLGMIGLNQLSNATTTLEEGLYYLRRGCDFDFGEACANLAWAYVGGMNVNTDNAVALALFDKACRLKDAGGCTEARKLAANRNAIPSIDPSWTVEKQLRLAKAAAEGGDRMMGVGAVVRLMQEGNEDAAWLLGGWLYYGLPGVFDTSRRADGLILFENAARVGHVDAAIYMGMAYWYGDGVAEDRAKGERYMLIAANRGNQMAGAIYRSMKAEPIRQENARRQKEYEEWAAARQNDWTSSWSNWTPASSAYTPSPPAWSGPSVSSIIDNSNWNQRINYLSGSTTACPGSNPYC
ncbi:MAG: hypothetical protein JWR84_1148 [Caulobacter sp.]|nr:hypothetical protein [Caulobacter sp.]